MRKVELAARATKDTSATQCLGNMFGVRLRQHPTTGTPPAVMLNLLLDESLLKSLILATKFRKATWTDTPALAKGRPLDAPRRSIGRVVLARHLDQSHEKTSGNC